MAESDKDLNKRLTDVTAVDIMSRFPVTIKETASLDMAAELMMRFRISGLPVISGQGEIVGIITATDLFRLMGEHEAGAPAGSKVSPESLRVGQVMSKNVHTIKQETTLKEMIQLMFGKNVHTMPVVESGEIVGVVGRRDVLNAYYYTPRSQKNG
jgi:CBS domain-containing protein